MGVHMCVAVCSQPLRGPLSLSLSLAWPAVDTAPILALQDNCYKDYYTTSLVIVAAKNCKGESVTPPALNQDGTLTLAKCMKVIVKTKVRRARRGPVPKYEAGPHDGRTQAYNCTRACRPAGVLQGHRCVRVLTPTCGLDLRDCRKPDLAHMPLQQPCEWQVRLLRHPRECGRVSDVPCHSHSNSDGMRC